jgi:protein required for attachment to host cells
LSHAIVQTIFPLNLLEMPASAPQFFKLGARAVSALGRRAIPNSRRFSMETIWIVTADEGRARIFSETDRSQPLEEVEDMVNAPARMRTEEKYTDRLAGPTAAGKSIHDTGGAVPNKQYEPPQTPEEHEAETFGKAICAYLLKAHEERRFHKLVLVAAPKFLGVLRAEIDPRLKPLLTREINKDLTHSSGHELRAQLQALNQKQ